MQKKLTRGIARVMQLVTYSKRRGENIVAFPTPFTLSPIINILYYYNYYYIIL
jgi:hypothetical protein